MDTDSCELRNGTKSYDSTKKVVIGYIATLKELMDPQEENDIDLISEKICNLCVSFTAEAEETYNPSSKSPPPFTLNNPYYSTISKAFDLLMDAVDGEVIDDGWKYQGEKQGVMKHRKDPDDCNIALFRGEKVLNHPRNVLLHALQSKDLRLALGDGAMVDCGILERVEEHCTVQFEQYATPVPFVSPRDIVYIHTIHQLPDGTILSFGSSVDHPARPRSNQFCRANLKIGGWAFKPVPNDPGKTRVCYVAQLDLAGYVPGWIMNRIASEIPMTIERLNKYLCELEDTDQFNKPMQRTNVIRAHSSNECDDDDDESISDEREDDATSNRTESLEANGTDDEREEEEEEEESEGTMDESWTGEHMPTYSIF